MDIVFEQLDLLMLGTQLEAVPADTVSFELCIYSYLIASCVHSDRVCRLHLFIINVLLLFECRWSHSLQILLHLCNKENTHVILNYMVCIPNHTITMFLSQCFVHIGTNINLQNPRVKSSGKASTQLKRGQTATLAVVPSL